MNLTGLFSMMMAQKAMNSATHKQLRDLAQDIIKTQTAEIQQLEQLSKASSSLVFHEIQ